MKHVKCYIKDYPRPQFVRNNFVLLSGKWDFAFDYENEGDELGYCNGFKKQHDINVPFAYQCPASGIGIDKPCNNVWYSTHISKCKELRTILNLEGCDYRTFVYINGNFVGSHEGGYERFSFDITKYLTEKDNLLVIKAEDSYSCYQARGKQRWEDKNFGCWYVDTTGIFKPVWLEHVSNSYVEYATIQPNIDTNTCDFFGKIKGYKGGLKLKVKITFDGAFVCENVHTLASDTFKLSYDLTSTVNDFKVKLWTHYSPNLYDVEYELIEESQVIDSVGSYFGVVKYECKNSIITQNYTKVYLKMLLDQGYFEDTHLSAPSEADLERDIKLTLNMGFNGIRKHQKIEDDRFYYYCDILGAIVWCEMPSAYDFSDEMTKKFTLEWQEVVLQHKSHPCIMAWVPFNESWGVMRIANDYKQQQFTEAMYHLTKALDGTRAVISNDGWEHTKSDIITLHNYSEYGSGIDDCYKDIDRVLSGESIIGNTPREVFASGYKYEGQPIIISEYAGIAFSKDKGKGWGYGNMVDSDEKFLARLKSVTDAIRSNPAISGYCVTQTTDVQQEVNGLLTADRRCKVDIKEIKKIND